MVPERRLYPWATVVRCGSKLARTPVYLTLLINLVHAAARRSERHEKTQIACTVSIPESPIQFLILLV